MARDPEAPPARLYLITPPLGAAAPFDKALAAALAAGDVACVLTRFATNDPGQRKAILRALTPLAQDHGAALLVDGDAQLAARAGADGAHISGVGQALGEAVESLKPERIVGAGGLDKKRGDGNVRGHLGPGRIGAEQRFQGVKHIPDMRPLRVRGKRRSATIA